MKVCPNCAFANPERFPTCIFCNALIVDVPSTPSPNPDDPEHAERAVFDARRRMGRKQIRTVAILYALFISGTAVLPGMVLKPEVLGLYLLSSVIVVGAILLDLVGQLSAPLLQGGLSVVLVIYFGPEQPFIFFMLAGHILGPAIFWHAIDTIQNAHR